MELSLLGRTYRLDGAQTIARPRPTLVSQKMAALDMDDAERITRRNWADWGAQYNSPEGMCMIKSPELRARARVPTPEVSPRLAHHPMSNFADPGSAWVPSGAGVCVARP